MTQEVVMKGGKSRSVSGTVQTFTQTLNVLDGTHEVSARVLLIFFTENHAYVQNCTQLDVGEFFWFIIRQPNVKCFV